MLSLENTAAQCVPYNFFIRLFLKVLSISNKEQIRELVVVNFSNKPNFSHSTGKSLRFPSLPVDICMTTATYDECRKRIVRWMNAKLGLNRTSSTCHRILLTVCVPIKAVPFAPSSLSPSGVGSAIYPQSVKWQREAVHM